MSQIQIKIQNGDRIIRAFQDFPDIVAPFLRDASTKSALLVERFAKILSPVDTGRLRSSIATSLGVRDLGITSIVQTNVFYAIFVHDGTVKMAGRPFMEQAANRALPLIEQIYEDETKAALEQMSKRAN